jgi:hypothetical protein
MRDVVEMGLRCHNTYMRFHKDWFRHSEVDRGGHRHTDSRVISKAYSYFFKIKKANYKCGISTVFVRVLVDSRITTDDKGRTKLPWNDKKCLCIHDTNLSRRRSSKFTTLKSYF